MMLALTTFVVVSGVLATLAAGSRDLPACYSATDAYVYRSFTVATKPLTSTLIQRYQGSELNIKCLSFVEYGPTCGSVSVPQLCSRLVSDASAAFSCETLTNFVTDPSADITRGIATGPEMIWLVKWDGTTKGVSCYPRQVEIRMLAFIRNSWESSDTVFVFLLIVAIISVLLMLVALYAHLRNRYNQIDNTGTTTIAGPKSLFRGPQLAVTAPTTYADVTTVYLPVRDSAALNEMTAAKLGQILSNPNTPHRSAIYLDDEFGAGGDTSQFPRGPGGSSMRRRRASPPAPGDGVHDPVLAQKMSEARRLRSKLRFGRRGVRDGDDDELDEDDQFRARSRGGFGDDDDDYEYDDNDNGYDSSTGRSGGRRRRNQPGGTRSRGGRPAGALFPTQAHLSVAGDGNEELFRQQYGSDRPLFEGAAPGSRGGGFTGFGPDGDTYDPEQSHMLPPGSGGPVVGKQNIRYVPQWMQGSFGRGGIIPEAGEAPDGDESGPNGNPQGRSIYLPDAPPGSTAKRYYEPTELPEDNQENFVGSMPLHRHATPTGGKQHPSQTPGSLPRSALKRRGDHQQPEDDDMLRRGVSFHGDARGRSFGGTLGGGGIPRAGGSSQDQFSRDKAKIHNRSLQLDASVNDPRGTANPNAVSIVGTDSNGKPIYAAKGDGAVPIGTDDMGNPIFAAAGERLAVVGTDDLGNPVYAPLGPNGRPVSAGGARGGVGAFECDDCHLRVNPASQDHAFCEATGLRHF